MGRPDNKDIEISEAFGKRIYEKLTAIENIAGEPMVNVPGNFPYKEGVKESDECPDTIEELCTLCGTCISVCPTEAIFMVEDKKIETDAKGCIMCCACVKNCPENARIVTVPRIKEITKKLSETCSNPKQPETFLNYTSKSLQE